MGCNQTYQIFPSLCLWRFFDLSGEVEIVPADDAIFDQAIAGLGNFLFLFFNLCVLARVSDSHGAGKTVSQFNFVELFFDDLSHGEIVNVSQNEQGFDDLTEGLESLIERVLA
jgi:hypothetical protein